MEIFYSSAKLAKVCNSQLSRRKKLGPREGDLLGRRLDDLDAADTLADVRPPFPGRCRELRENRRGQLAMDLVHPRRLIFSPANDPVPRNDAGGLDWSRVTKILIEEIGTDYHK